MEGAVSIGSYGLSRDAGKLTPEPRGTPSMPSAAGGYGTNGALPSTPGPQVVDGNGRPVRARTADLHRVKVAL